ncbi:glycosyltransferase [Marinobacterium litorale]|uniref:glycosyltransferase n=1 Tax=Marinobacterium litorale TaxID=404770 RepID=UPI0003FC560A|nr:glycosyltransferase [Marinobacterium litorale]
MKILFIHQNFPGQFKHLAPALVSQGHQVVAMSMKKSPPSQWNGVTIVPFSAQRGSTPGVHPWLVDFETKVVRAEACYRAAKALKAQGFVPDIIIAHPGWGESLFLKEVWPQARLGVYCEFFYRQEGADVGFDPEFARDFEDDGCRLRLKNLNSLLHFETADGGISPTHWQASTFPEPFRSQISVIHDGIDTNVLVPNEGAALKMQTSTGATFVLDRSSEVVTFVNRNLEPYRGFHIFMRALPELLKKRPKARVVIVGGEGVSYGAAPKDAKSWKEKFVNEVRPQIPDSDWSRVHFVGNLAYNHFINLLQLSRVHVYLTYPFVLSWSLLEAMSAGCAIVASDTQPLKEAIHPNETGRLVNFFDGAALVEQVVDLLDDDSERTRLGNQARAFACDTYDLNTRCLPAQLEWVGSLAQ